MPRMNSHKASTRDALAALLRACANSLAELPASEVDAVLNGELELRLITVDKMSRRKRQNAVALEVEQLSEIASRLRSLDSREAGERLLGEVAPSKSALEALARYLDVGVRREDRLDGLVRRIVEATIGFRLSSAAVRGRTAVRRYDAEGDSYLARPKK